MCATACQEIWHLARNIFVRATSRQEIWYLARLKKNVFFVKSKKKIHLLLIFHRPALHCMRTFASHSVPNKKKVWRALARNRKFC